MWDLPGPGLEPVSPASAGRFLTPAPPGKPPDHHFCTSVLQDVTTGGNWVKGTLNLPGLFLFFLNF